MRPFKFRAQVVLDLRKRQDEEAQRKLGEAVRRRLEAETTVEVAAAAVDASIRQARQTLDQPATTTEHGWHRNWIASRQHELAATRVRLAQSRASEQLARQRAQEARRALRMLERWYERAWQRDQHERRRLEQTELDALATMQYVARRRAEGDDEWKS